MSVPQSSAFQAPLRSFGLQAHECQHVHKLHQGLCLTTLLRGNATLFVLPVQQILQTLMLRLRIRLSA
jgi:hypothetical protein